LSETIMPDIGLALAPRRYLHIMSPGDEADPLRYDASRAAAFYDEYGDREWTRFDDGRTGQASLAIHTEYLRRFIAPGQHVLDVGAGPGRFTMELARLGARLTVADLSTVQLRQNEERVAEAGLASQVVDRVQADVCDLSQFETDAFDATVCYGGPLSYVLDRADDALGELIRVTKPGGLLLLSVMSLVGAALGNLAAVVALTRVHGVEAVRAVMETGDLPPQMSGGHLAMHMYRWSELEAQLRRHRLEVVAASAATLAVGLEETFSADELAEVTRWQIDLAAEPGAIDAGGHIIAVARKPTALVTDADEGGR
jgi:ubiquinone/menaquinone biosynthesis C-methylase UbiE